ncbi:MAG: hypothetical protein CO141_03455 [Candidatus Moranbacteria bacterium CG_4_9_14_3_um_filter_42_9]|nr:MAG: hypothetical protein CO141_03455 [Candidatus Moranbacteria bacterium CG_4_9_14_3_um_filter_42_9]
MPEKILDFEKEDMQKVLAWQWRQVRAALKRASRIKFYKDLFQKEKINIEKIKDFKGLELIPVTTEEDLRADSYSFLGYPMKKIWRIFATSGTTGTPKIIFREPISPERPEILSVWINIFRRFRFWPEKAAIMRPAGGLAASGPVTAKIMELLEIPCITLSPESEAEKTAEVLLAVKPDLLVVSPSFAALIVYELKKKKINPRKLGVRAVISTGEALRANERFYLEKELGARVINTYGAADPSVWIASECEKKGMHILPYTSYVETVDSSGRKSDEGELLVTPFANRAMPLLRYRLGDRAKLDGRKCACGRKLPRITALERREKPTALKVERKIVRLPLRKILTQLADEEPKISSFFNFHTDKVSGRARLIFEADFYRLKKSARKKIEDSFKKKFLSVLESREKGMGKAMRLEVKLVPIGELPRRAAKLVSQLTET